MLLYNGVGVTFGQKKQYGSGKSEGKASEFEVSSLVATLREIHFCRSYQSIVFLLFCNYSKSSEICS